MVRTVIFLIFLFYFLVLFQNSFLIHFKIFGAIPNLVFILIILINFLEKPEGKIGLVSVIAAGFYLDIFSISGDFFFGFYVLIFLIIALFFKLVLKKYVRIPTP